MKYPPRPASAPFNFKMHPPAKKKKHGEAETGRGRTRGTPRVVASKYRSIGAYEKLSSHHALGACDQSLRDWK